MLLASTFFSYRHSGVRYALKVTRVTKNNNDTFYNINVRSASTKVIPDFNYNFCFFLPKADVLECKNELKESLSKFILEKEIGVTCDANINVICIIHNSKAIYVVSEKSLAEFESIKTYLAALTKNETLNQVKLSYNVAMLNKAFDGKTVVSSDNTLNAYNVYLTYKMMCQVKNEISQELGLKGAIALKPFTTFFNLAEKTLVALETFTKNHDIVNRTFKELSSEFYANKEGASAKATEIKSVNDTVTVTQHLKEQDKKCASETPSIQNSNPQTLVKETEFNKNIND